MEPFNSPIQQFMYLDKYSRFIAQAGRRETWHETVNRTVNFLEELAGEALDHSTLNRIRWGIYDMNALPSMRMLAMAGPAARRSNIAIYNCSYLAVNKKTSFAEALLISMNGCGVGFSVEKQFVQQLPEVEKQSQVPGIASYTIPDTTEGWVEAVNFGINCWWSGLDTIFDYSLIRPAGSPLAIKGGTASGPEPLKRMLDFLRTTILNASGRKLKPIEVYDMMCMVGEAAVCGGTRRTAMICLFDEDDQEMLEAKFPANFEWLGKNYQRSNANNSVVLNEPKTKEELERIILAMHESGSGEPGIFNRYAARMSKPERREDAVFGTNPCAEIVLNDRQFCNLSIAVARPGDTIETLKDKVELATIIGTIQSLATNFPGLPKIWKENCEKERLLGVDITGQWDVPELFTPENLIILKNHVIETNKRWSKRFGINQSASVSCVKPSGNSGQLLNVSSGMHARWSKYYIRHITVGNDTPMYAFLRDQGVPLIRLDSSKSLIPFPVKAPEGAVTRSDLSVSDQLAYWEKIKLLWTEHNPSITIYYTDKDLQTIIDFLSDPERQKYTAGLSFAVDFDMSIFANPPYKEITREEFEVAYSQFPDINWDAFYPYDNQIDNTTSSMEPACVGGSCELTY